MRFKISEGRNRCSRKHGVRTSLAVQWLSPLLLGAAEGRGTRQSMQSPDVPLQLTPHQVGMVQVTSLRSTGPSRTVRDVYTPGHPSSFVVTSRHGHPRVSYLTVEV